MAKLLVIANFKSEVIYCKNAIRKKLILYANNIKTNLILNLILIKIINLFLLFHFFFDNIIL